MGTIICGDALQVLRILPDHLAACCVTSPPYWNLRDYGMPGQIGLEATPQEYVSRLVSVFDQVRRVLRPDGTLWLNLGDAYANDTKWGGSGSGPESKNWTSGRGGYAGQKVKRHTGLKPKDLIGLPWMVAFALRDAGWYLRSDIIWHKPNAMPDPTSDRPTKAHEYIFLLAKNERYYYDADAVAEDSVCTHSRLNGYKRSARIKYLDAGEPRGSDRPWEPTETRNRRSVWTVSTRKFPGAHFATFPPNLIEPCILAGSRPGDLVLDPFFGAGTTGVVARRHSREYLGIELNSEYCQMAEDEIAKEVQPVLWTA